MRRSALAYVLSTPLLIAILAAPPAALSQGISLLPSKQLFIDPIPGLTTARHPAPLSAAVPLGTALRLRRPVQPGSSVAWLGAQEVSNDGVWSVAEVLLGALGPRTLAVRYTRVDGLVLEDRMLVDVIPDTPASMEVLEVGAEVATSVSSSVAAVRKIDESLFRTSVLQRARFSAEVSPSGLASLLEWRYAGPRGEPAALLGTTAEIVFHRVGLHPIEVGPPGNARRIVLETYSAEISSHQVGDLIPEGQPNTFSAVTDPPGYEDEILWHASAAVGKVRPTHGEGPTFTVHFEDNFTPPLFGPEPIERLAVRADNATFAQAKGCSQDRGCNDPKLCDFDGIANLALGNSTLALNNRCNLIVGGVGSTGLDGVRQFPLPADSTAMVTGVACPNFVLSEQGARGEFIMYGDVPGDRISTLTVENIDGDNLRTEADFSPVGVTTYTVQIMNGLEPVAEFKGLKEAVAVFPKTDYNEIDCRIEPEYHISYEVTRPLPIAIAGVEGTYEGDVIWVIGIDPTVTATVQTAIDNFFIQTGPVEMTFQFAGPEKDFPHPIGPPFP